MPRLDHLRTSPRFDRSHWPQEWTSSWRIQVLDLFAGRGGTGRALDKVLPRRMYLGVDHEDFSDEYPGQFTVADLIDPENRPFDGVTADVVWVSWPCTAYAEPSAVEYGSAEAALEENPRITDEFREWLLSISAHYIIENVPNASYYGDLDANVQLNGLAFGEQFDNRRVFETTFTCPDAYYDGEPEITMALDDDQSVQELADAKGVPSSWGKSGVRSAMPWQYVFWLLHHCPSVSWPWCPEREQHTIYDATGDTGSHSMFGTGCCGGHKCSGECHGNHGPTVDDPGFNTTVVRDDSDETYRHSSFLL